MRAICVVLGLATASGPLGAQALAPGAAAAVVQTHLLSQVASGSARFSGVLAGGQGVLSVGRVGLALSYVQGRVAPDGASGPGYDLVEGSVLLGARPVPWLTVSGGPHARAYGLLSGTERWLFWELRVRAAGAWVGSAARGYAELWRAVSASVNVPETFDHAQGAEVGMAVHFARAPLEVRLAYRLDHAVLRATGGPGLRLETVDGVLVALGVSGR
ncbi:MAG TPA: hypothetical protein VM736_15495 [Gemmatimonadales bacterium]|nr:hypothetical protein [Gemmatimonadales bacterium]